MPHVLIIAEDPNLRGQLCAALSQLNCRVSESPEGVEGIKEYMHNRPDLVLCDLDAGARNSLTTIQQIRHMDPNALIVAVSHENRSIARNTLESALNVGAVVSVTKPIDSGMLEMLLNVVELPDAEIDEDVAATSTLFLKHKVCPDAKQATT